MVRRHPGGAGTPGAVGGVAFLLVGAVLALTVAPALDAFALGDEAGRALGVAPGRVRLLGTLATVLLSGAATAAIGPVGFIGLVAPHVARLLTGPDHRRLMPYAVLIGAGLLLVADIVGRVIARPAEIQVGIVTAFRGRARTDLADRPRPAGPPECLPEGGGPGVSAVTRTRSRARTRTCTEESARSVSVRGRGAAHRTLRLAPGRLSLRIRPRPLAVTLLLALLAGGSGALALTRDGLVPPAEVLGALFGAGSEQAAFVVLELRLPRVALGLVVGAALGRPVRCSSSSRATRSAARTSWDSTPVRQQGRCWSCCTATRRMWRRARRAAASRRR